MRTLEKVNAEALFIAAGQNIKRLLPYSQRGPRREAQVIALRRPTPNPYEFCRVRKHRKRCPWRPPKVFQHPERPLQHQLALFGRRSQQSFLSQRLEDALPKALLQPQLVAPVGGLPLAVLLRHLPPGGTRSRHPQDATEHRAVIVVRSPCWRLVRDERLDYLPLFVGKRRSFRRKHADLRTGAFLGRFFSTQDVPSGSTRLFAAGGNRLPGAPASTPTIRTEGFSALQTLQWRVLAS